ncbi:MAG: hypothetical protein JWN72_1372 [Thermoleophilia bacterium]|nr:hypothetical protein [Thermoleophilia bacterium]
MQQIRSTATHTAQFAGAYRDELGELIRRRVAAQEELHASGDERGRWTMIAPSEREIELHYEFPDVAIQLL